MRRRIVVAALAITAGILAACSDNTLPTAPVSGPSLKSTINADGCVDSKLKLAVINPIITGLITNLFGDQNQRSSTLSMWENMKKDKLEGRPLLNHIDNLTKWTLDHLAARTLSDPDGAGVLNATTGSVKLLDIVFRCAGQTPTSVPTVPAGFDALFKLVAPSGADQQFNTSFDDAAAFLPDGSLDGSTLLVLVRQPEEVNVNTPFPKVSRTVDVALAGGKLVDGKHLSVLFCPFESVDHDRNNRLVVAHQLKAVAPTAPVGEGVEYLAPGEGGHLDCPHGIAFNPQQGTNLLTRSVLRVASLASKAFSFVGAKNLYAGHAAIGGLISRIDEDELGDVSGLSPMVLVDPFVETEIVGVSIPETTYGDEIAFTAQLQVKNVPATCGLPTSPAVCGWVGHALIQTLAGMPPLTLADLKISATLDGHTQNNPIGADGIAHFNFTHINAGDDQTASLAFAHTINRPANAPDFAPSALSPTYTVHKRPLSAVATASTWNYGDAQDVTGAFTGAVQYDEDVTATFTTVSSDTTQVGVYPGAVVANVLFGDGVRAANYDVTKTNATLTINKVPLTVTAADKSREYGVAGPTFTADVVGIQNGDAHTETFETTALIGSDVSGPTYPIKPFVTGPRLDRNYTITLTPGALTINPAPLHITISSLSRPYGDANPSLTTEPFTTRNSDVLDVALATGATALSPIGEYPITGTVSGTKVGNYAITLTPGTLTVSKRFITIAADNASRDEGEANPPFTGTIGGGGLVSGDLTTVTYDSPATTDSPPLHYPINPHLNGTAGANYNATITAGDLEVKSKLDQSNDFPAVPTSIGCGVAGGHLYQSFKPTATSLSAIALRFRAGGEVPAGGETITIQIREGTPGGDVVGTATATVAHLSTGETVLAKFTFATPLSVTSGGVYVIDLTTMAEASFTWAATTSDTYAGGNAFGCAPEVAAIFGQDFYFKTYR